MQTLRHVVVGTDFSEAAGHAIEWVLQIAAATAAKVTVVHVCELDDDGNDERRMLACGEALTREVARHQHRGVEVTGVLRCGRPWEKLDNVAAEVGADLIVVGRHGVGRSTRGAIGSVAERLVRHASRPVLTVSNELDRLEVEAHDTHDPFRKRETP